MDCLFCKIIEGSIPSKKVYETEDIYAELTSALDVTAFGQS